MLVISIVWGSTFLAYKISFASFPPFTLAAIRFIVGGGILFIWGTNRVPLTTRPSGRQWRSAIVAGALLFLIGNGATVWSQTRLSSGLGGLVVGTIPVWTALYIVLVRQERVSRKSAAAIGIGFLGLVVLAVDTGVSAGDNSPIALYVAIAGVIAWSIGSIHTNGPSMPEDPILAAGMQMMTGGVLLAIAGVLFGELGEIGANQVTIPALIALFYLAVPNALTFGMFVWLLRVAPPVMVSVYAYVAPLVALALGWGFLSEPITGPIIAGAILVLMSIFVLVTPPHWAVQRLSALSPAPVFRRIRGTEPRD